ncbi:lipoate--protein ligase family protein [Gracilinema caldarium]|uniref:Biotin/lipoate A/B protein ligase n=1 Tax=Gracilinema caldarium (strain ATCC 51460 / DSM 7334 / H1) TaxID=744872 RepID=F8F2W2_GRAC1|nr:biotin/lipoate A/B protein ligase family protein [Gracilinema caldarium]AEJ19870.1 biotin/lipoate A/B protein ligase [Gracilinema caldarium DSM 7334]
MAYQWRLLRTGFHNAFYNMGLDQAILEAVAAAKAPPTLRFYGWQPPAISIGYFQGMQEEVDLSACRQHGIDTVRRITGGGAVFHQSEVTYSIVLPFDHPLADQNILASYGRLCQGIVAGLAKLGVTAEFAPINDIVVGGRKISGNAQTRKLGCILQHGTILLDVDVDLMFTLLKVPSEKARGKAIADVKERVTSLSRILGRTVSFDAVSMALEQGFREALDLNLVVEQPSAAELERAENLARSRFASEDWNLKR